MVRRQPDRGGDQGEREHLPAPTEAERPPVAQLRVVVGEPDRAAGERRAEDRQRGEREVAERQEGDRRREQDQDAAQCGRALLLAVPLRSLLADVLAELVPPQERDEGRTA